MPGFSWRFRVDVASWCALAVAEDTLTLPLLETAGGQRIVLAGDDGQPLSKSHRLELFAHGWETREAAQAAGQKLGDVLLLSLMHIRMGVESWTRRAPGGLFLQEWTIVEEENASLRILNDSIGLTVYETDPTPKFAWAMRLISAVRWASARAFVECFEALAAMEIELTAREQVAIDLYNASFFEPAADTRVITLVMAIEAMAEREDRPAEALALVDQLITHVQASNLTEPDKAPLVTAVTALRLESIRSAGRRLVRQRLAGVVYEGEAAEQLFERSVTFRNELIHGGAIRGARELGADILKRLEPLVSDLLLWRFLGPGVRSPS